MMEGRFLTVGFRRHALNKLTQLFQQDVGYIGTRPGTIIAVPGGIGGNRS